MVQLISMEVFMGDTGFGARGLIGIIAFMTLQPTTLVIVGGVFVMEAMSVIYSCIYKSTKRRIFLMSLSTIILN
ncbi:MAG: hypothetical protein ACLUKN_01065 [Bacilli bacterium]